MARKKVEQITCDVCGARADGTVMLTFFDTSGLQLNQKDLCRLCGDKVGSAIEYALQKIKESS